MFCVLSPGWVKNCFFFFFLVRDDRAEDEGRTNFGDADGHENLGNDDDAYSFRIFVLCPELGPFSVQGPVFE